MALCIAALAGVLVGVCVGRYGIEVVHMGWETGLEPVLSDGRIEAPEGVDPTSLRVTASRDGRHRDTTTPAADGTFRLLVSHGGPFDLHVSDWETWRDPFPRDGSPPEPAPTHAVEGGLRGVGWGDRNLRVPLTRAALVNASVRVRADDGSPVLGATVYLQSHGDQVSRLTDAEGLARFEGLPPRTWRATASRPGHSLLTGWTDFLPSGVEVPLQIPQGIEVRVRLADGVRANFVGGCEIPHMSHVYFETPWKPGPDGSMTLRVPHDLPTLALTAGQRDQLNERTTTERSVAAGAVAVREGVTLLLEPLAR